MESGLETAALGVDARQLRSHGALCTAREIAQQPALWRQVAQMIAGDAVLGEFLAPVLEDPQLRVLFTGAGSSAYIGECLAPALVRAGVRAEAIATTDIVADPARALAARTMTLVVHFARSGNSPESVAALELAENHLSRCAHLIVTCNGEGQLYRRAGSVRQAHALLLPEASHDQSFAMTSSFSAMLLAGAIALRIFPTGGASVPRLAELASQVLDSGPGLVATLVRAQFSRVVYLGSSELEALAREAALKMLELTDGRVVSVASSPLALRHGPKTILNGDTLVVAFLSRDTYRRRYELDLLAELRRDGVAGRIVALSNCRDLPGHDDTLVLGDAAGASGLPLLTDVELCLPYVVFAQALAMQRSLSLGLQPDRPNAAGTVNRVVQGVTIHAYGAAR